MASPLGFKARVGSALFALGGGVRNIRVNTLVTIQAISEDIKIPCSCRQVRTPCLLLVSCKATKD